MRSGMIDLGFRAVFMEWFAYAEGFEEMFRVLLDFLKPDWKGEIIGGIFPGREECRLNNQF